MKSSVFSLVRDPHLTAPLDVSPCAAITGSIGDARFMASEEESHPSV